MKRSMRDHLPRPFFFYRNHISADSILWLASSEPKTRFPGEHVLDPPYGVGDLILRLEVEDWVLRQDVEVMHEFTGLRVGRG